MNLDSASEIRTALTRVGERLAFEGERFAVVVLGGAALNLLDIVRRPTSDVDILAFATRLPGARTAALHAPPEPIPEPLARAIADVGRDMGLDPHWMNTGPALQWRQGLPPGLASRVAWQHFGPPDAPDVGLDVGLVSRYDLIFFKLYAAADDATTRSVHYKDLLALAPTGEELDAAAAWVRTQDASSQFHKILDQVVAHARHQLR
jgi:hypothetical protein